MIQALSIKNFKSIKNMELQCGKINLFIGEPNVGKSNILEALGVLNWCGCAKPSLQKYVRYTFPHDLFYDGILDEPIEIKVLLSTNLYGMQISFEDNHFWFSQENETLKNISPSGIVKSLQLDYLGNATVSQYFPIFQLNFIKFYRYENLNEFSEMDSSYLLPPHGSNLFTLVVANKKLRETMSMFFKNLGFTLVFKPQTKSFEFQKRSQDVVFSYPYIVASDTIQRVIFYTIAMESNKNSTLVFEEPESHAFPYYTKYLGERIGFDETNQYFIATHNPYLLSSILEKAKKEDVRVFIVYFKDYQTKVKALNGVQISEVMDIDPFFNLKSFIEE